jgi:hypothetical protein
VSWAEGPFMGQHVPRGGASVRPPSQAP